MMLRVLEPETLDGLAVDDPHAQRSRRDLRRVHRFMGTRSIMLRGLADLRALGSRAVPRVLELGAGDGTLMLGVAKVMVRFGLRAELTLLDRLDCVDRETLDAYAGLGWHAVTHVIDVADWVKRAEPSRWDAIVANLFLHHFDTAALSALLGAIAARTDRFFACEPRRGWIALGGSHLIGAIGVNAVTRNDAVLSVRAGFAGHELSALWPSTSERWQLDEYGAGLFSHCLRATRREAT